MSKTTDQIRVENARWLCEHEAGGVLAEFGRRMGASNRQQVANWIGKTPVRAISSETARQIERAFGKPVGWLDVEHGAAGQVTNDVVISRLASRTQFPGVLDAAVERIATTREWVRRNVGARAPEHLALATVTGNAMPDSLPEGSLVLVDRSVSAIQEDGVYMLASMDDQDRPVFRSATRGIDGAITLSAENLAIKPERIKALKTARLLVLGRVVVVLQVRRL